LHDAENFNYPHALRRAAGFESTSNIVSGILKDLREVCISELPIHTSFPVGSVSGILVNNRDNYSPAEVPFPRGLCLRLSFKTEGRFRETLDATNASTFWKDLLKLAFKPLHIIFGKSGVPAVQQIELNRTDITLASGRDLVTEFSHVLGSPIRNFPRGL
jgi:hypothetical protein